MKLNGDFLGITACFLIILTLSFFDPGLRHVTVVLLGPCVVFMALWLICHKLQKRG